MMIICAKEDSAFYMAVVHHAQRLDDIRARAANTRRQLEAAEDNVEQAVLSWKLGQLEERAGWLESVLSTGKGA